MTNPIFLTGDIVHVSYAHRSPNVAYLPGQSDALVDGDRGRAKYSYFHSYRRQS